MMEPKAHRLTFLRSWLIGAAGGLLLALAAGCVSAEESLQRFQRGEAEGEFEAAESALRTGLEAHPDDVPLLLAAAGFYLRSEPSGLRRPRLSLHYLLRLDRVLGPDPRTGRLFLEAYQAAGTLPEEAELIQRGLTAIRHPEAEAPRARPPLAAPSSVQ